jgi:hypothetical protein
MVKRLFASKDTHRIIEWSLITCGFALALVVIASGIR